MPTFDDPLADGEEARQALRALAHATRSFAIPAHTYEVIGELLGGLRSLEQVLQQVASVHTAHEEFAFTTTASTGPVSRRRSLPPMRSSAPRFSSREPSGP